MKLIVIFNFSYLVYTFTKSSYLFLGPS